VAALAGDWIDGFREALRASVTELGARLSESVGGSSRERAVHAAAEQHAWPHRHNQTGII